MDVWYQCENPYPFVPQDVLDGVDSVRGSLPNRYCDPRTAADLERLVAQFSGDVAALQEFAGREFAGWKQY